MPIISGLPVKAGVDASLDLVQDSLNRKADLRFNTVAITGGSSASNVSAYSQDGGKTWTTSTLPASRKWTSVTCGNGRFVAVAQGASYAAYSDNGGKTWSSCSMPGSYNYSAITYGNGKFVALASGSTYAVYSSDGSTWNQYYNYSLSSKTWRSVAYGAGVFVGISATTAAAYSSSGTTWTAMTLPVAPDTGAITYGNGKFVIVVANSNQSMYSTNGTAWNTSSLPDSDNWSSITAGNGRFVAIARGSDKAAYSNDGINWISSTLPASASWSTVSYNGYYFVAVADGSNIIAYSNDGVVWVDSTLPSSASWVCAASAPATLPVEAIPILDYDKKGSASTALSNAKTYADSQISSQISSADAALRAFATEEAKKYGGGGIRASGKAIMISNDYNHSVYYSNDGETWTPSGGIGSSDSTPICIYGDNKFVVCSYDNVMYTPVVKYSTNNGLEWTNALLPALSFWTPFAGIYGGGKFIIAPTSSQTVLYSSDGVQWSSINLPKASFWTGLTYGNGKFVMVGYESEGGNTLLTSSDGITWTAQNTTQFDGCLKRVTYGNKIFVLTTTMSVYTSNDGVVWNVSPAALNGLSYSHQIAYGNEVFVLKSDFYSSYISLDGVNWSHHSSETQVYDSLGFLGFVAGRFVATTNSGEWAYSVDGKAWTKADSGSYITGASSPFVIPSSYIPEEVLGGGTGGGTSTLPCGVVTSSTMEGNPIDLKVLFDTEAPADDMVYAPNLLIFIYQE